MNLRRMLIAAAVALLAAPAAFAFFAEAEHGRAAALLEEIREAQERVRYAGRKVVETPEGTTTLDLRAERPGRARVEHASRPSGRRPHPWAGRGARGRFSDPALIAENYRLESRRALTIAGRDADQYALLPRQGGRASYEFAVDRQTRFLLAFRTVAEGGAKLHDSRFETIQFDPPAAEAKAQKAAAPKPAQDQPRRVVRQRVKEEDLRRAMDFPVWMPSWTPPGFKLRSLERYDIRGLGEAILARWSDGMTGFHIVQTDASNTAWELFRGAYLGLPETPPASEDGGPVAWRIRHAGGALLDLTLDGTEILIGGQIDPDDLKKIADHLRNIDH
jgi:negative regulator of sigma E activity